MLPRFLWGIIMKALLDNCRAVLKHERVAHGLHKSHGWAHMGYLGAVSYEAHGWYGKCAALLLVISVVMAFAGIGTEE